MWSTLGLPQAKSVSNTSLTGGTRRMGQCRSLDLKDVIVDQPLRNTSFGRVDAHHRISFQPVAKGRGEHFEVEVTVGEATNQLLSGEHHADPRVSAVAQLTRQTSRAPC